MCVQVCFQCAERGGDEWGVGVEWIRQRDLLPQAATQCVFPLASRCAQLAVHLHNQQSPSTPVKLVECRSNCWVAAEHLQPWWRAPGVASAAQCCCGR